MDVVNQNKTLSPIEQLGQSPWKMKLYMLRNLPMGLIAGLRLEQLGEDFALVSLPFRFINKNPFRSIYFASLSMAAELSTGILAMRAVSKADIPVSMLVLSMRAEFLKKATTRIHFRCNDGIGLETAVKKCIQTNEGQIVEAMAVGKNTDGEIVANFWFTWTFKTKNKFIHT